MCEMEETCNIMQSASARSLVIVDEVGRGTSTVDGLAIAWAVLEHLCLHIRCRTLFATHFHELGALAEHGTPGDVADEGMALPGLRAMQMGIHDTSGGLAMTHQLTPGMASQSYGLHVAEI